MLNILWTILFIALPPCAQEDSANCSWNAQHSGNGVGTSFFDLNGTAYYRDGSYMDKAGYLWKPMNRRQEREIGHGDCVMAIGETTRVKCGDGFRTTS